MSSTTYCTADGVADFLGAEVSFDANTNPSAARVNSYILDAERELERETGMAWRPVWLQDEIHDIESWRTRHRDLFFDEWWAIPRPTQLTRAPLVPLDSSRHSVEVYEGTEDNNGDWTEVLTKTQGRDAQWWVDEMAGRVYIEEAFLERRNAKFRFSLEYGKPIPTLASTLSSGSTTVSFTTYHNKGATYRFPRRGYCRIENEWLRVTGRDDANDELTVERGALDTDDVDHSSGAEVIHVPLDVRNLTRMRAATKLLENERFQSIVPEGGGGSVEIGQATQRWRDEWQERIRSTYGRWEAI